VLPQKCLTPFQTTLQERNKLQMMIEMTKNNISSRKSIEEHSSKPKPINTIETNPSTFLNLMSRERLKGK
jgi:hypothetical protein